MRKKNESYLDEFGNEIKGYRTIFSLVLKQVDEVENNNYAVNQFEGDKYDLCSISKYLSHQRTFSDRQNIISKMGEALGSECDPSMPYKRKLYGNPASTSVKNWVSNLTSFWDIGATSKPKWSFLNFTSFSSIS